MHVLVLKVIYCIIQAKSNQITSSCIISKGLMNISGNIFYIYVLCPAWYGQCTSAILDYWWTCLVYRLASYYLCPVWYGQCTSAILDYWWPCLVYRLTSYYLCPVWYGQANAPVPSLTTGGLAWFTGWLLIIFGMARYDYCLCFFTYE